MSMLLETGVSGEIPSNIANCSGRVETGVVFGGILSKNVNCIGA
jgi:hypothetical protein